MSKKLFLSKRSVFFFAVLLFCGATFAFKGTIFNFALKKYVAHKIPLEGDWDFNYSYISLQEKGVVFHNISLFSKTSKTKCQIGKISCHAPMFESVSLSNHFVVEDLELSFAQKLPAQGGISPNKLRSILHSLRQIEIKNGKIKIPGKEVDFSLAKSGSGQKLGGLTFSSPLEGAVKMDLSSWADRWIIDIEARQSNLVFYKEVVDFFLSGKTSDWKVEKGKLDGTVFVAIDSKNSIKDARVHMNLLDGKISHPGAGMQSSFERVFIDLSYPMETSSKSFIENIKITSSVDKGEICFFNEEGDSRFHFKDLSGFMTTTAFKQAAVEITGYIDDRGKLLPINLAGSPAKKQDTGLELDLSLELDPSFGHKAHVNLICLHEDGTFFVKSKLDSLEVRQMLILQLFAGLFNPEFREYTLNNGTYSGEIFVAFDSKGIKDFSLRNLLCEDLGIYSPKHDLAVEAKSIAGEFKIDLFQNKKTTFSGWKMELVDGSITVGREDAAPYYIENTNCKIVTRAGVFTDSVVSAELKGIKGRLNIDGDITSPVFEVVLSGKGKDALTWFTEEAKDYDNEIMVSARVEKKENIYEGAGSVTLHKDDISSEVSFECITENQNIQEVRFQSDHLSGVFYPFLNEVLGFDWTIDGDFVVDGSYDKESLCLDVEGVNSTYREVHSFIKEAKGTARFKKTFSDNSWNLDLHLTEGHKKMIAGKNVFLQNADITVSSEDLFFKVRDFEGHIDFLENIPRFYLSARKFDIKKDKSFVADLSISNEYFELARISGKYEGGKISLDEYSHLLTEKLYLHECDFNEGVKLAIDSTVHLDDIVFPNAIRDANIGDVLLSVNIDNISYVIDVKSSVFKATVKGKDNNFTLACKDEVFDGILGDNGMSIGPGHFEVLGKKISLKNAYISKNDFSIEGSVIDDNMNFTGNVKGLFGDRVTFTGKGRGCLRLTGDYPYIVESIDDFTFSFDKKGIVHDCHFMVLEKGAMLGEFFAKSTCIYKDASKVSFHGLDGTIANDILKQKTGIEIKDDAVHFTADADLLLDEKDFWFSGKVDKGDFVVYDKTISADAISVRGNKKSLIADMRVPLYGELIDITSYVFFEDKTVFRIDGTYGEKKVLEVDGAFKDCLEIYRMKGELSGLAFDITPSSELYDSDFKVEMNLDLEKMKVFLPVDAIEFVEKLDLKKGIEVIGEARFKNGLTFDGLIKGTDFDFLDYSISSMFAKFSYKEGDCKLTDFSIADRSFIASCQEIGLDFDNGCAISANEFLINNLRPCLLSKKGERKKLSNPFMVEEIKFQDIKGNLQNLDTITGKGHIKFINSFDKNTNPVFDFAKEIIARIGLDPVLMVPVVGELEFSLADSKMNFLKMQNTFSDQGRSYFFLWNKGPSYLDFDGNLHIDIRMKQYVLFKFTELFVISLDGPVSSPKVFLK